MNINTATEDELLKHGLESEPHIDGADVAKRLVAARPFTSWKDLAHREGFSWKHCSFLYGEHYRLHDGELLIDFVDGVVLSFPLSSLFDGAISTHESHYFFSPESRLTRNIYIQCFKNDVST